MIARRTQSALLPIFIEGVDTTYDTPDEFVYGFRSVYRVFNGRDDIVRVPLTLDDILHPLEDDVVNQCHSHVLIGAELFYVLQDWLQSRPGMLVMFDSLAFLDTDEVDSYGPDIIVLCDVHTLPTREAYKHSKHGGQPVIIIEITSRSTRHIDVSLTDPSRSKYLHYQRLGIPYYVVIDEARRKGTCAPAMWGYVLRHGVYEQISPDMHGRIWIDPLQVSLGPHHTGVAWYDANGMRILTYTEQRERAEQEHTIAQQERARADEAEHRARLLEDELNRLKAQSEQSD